MLSVLKNTTYRRLFAAQIVALLGTGLATVALGLLAYDLAGADAGVVLGTALAIKMIAYVGVSPIASAISERLPRRRLLVALDAVRAGVVVFLPFVDQVWQIYVLIFLLQSASAAFTPAFQATIPDILPSEHKYTKALSLSRLAYDLENLVSPALAAALLTVMSFHWLFAGTAVGFLFSALLVLSVLLPRQAPRESGESLSGRMIRGLRTYLATPRLRGLLALNLAASAAGAMVIVNTVVYVRGLQGRGEPDVALALAVFGAGSVIAALALPRLLERIADRPVMIGGGAGLAITLAGLGAFSVSDGLDWGAFLAGWLLIGLFYSAVLIPSGRLLRRSAHQNDRIALFAAQFSLSHACWLLTYPLAGWAGAALGMPAAFLLLAIVASIGLLASMWLWPSRDPEILTHVHTGLAPDHPHVRDAWTTREGYMHTHPFVIDGIHRQWPT